MGTDTGRVLKIPPLCGIGRASPRFFHKRRPIKLGLPGLEVLAGGLAVVLSAGCQSDEITSYTVPKEARSGQGPAKGEKVRLLAAVMPHGDRTWFLKLVGPEADVSAQQPAFDRLVQSVNFPDKAAEPIAWTVPEGWRQEPGNEQRYATFRIEGQSNPLELTVVA